MSETTERCQKEIEELKAERDRLTEELKTVTRHRDEARAKIEEASDAAVRVTNAAAKDMEDLQAKLYVKGRAQHFLLPKENKVILTRCLLLLLALNSTRAEAEAARDAAQTEASQQREEAEKRRRQIDEVVKEKDRAAAEHLETFTAAQQKAAAELQEAKTGHEKERSRLESKIRELSKVRRRVGGSRDALMFN